MTREELIAAALLDSHKENYETEAPRYLQMAEGLIRSKLEAYVSVIPLTDAQRNISNRASYSLGVVPSLVIRVLRSDFQPLRLVDETTAFILRESAETTVYHVNPSGDIIVGGIPADGATMTAHVYGMPAALVLDADTNQLLTDYPQIYIEAMHVYIYKRAKNFDGASAAMQSVVAMINQVNRRMKKLTGGTNAINVHNTDFRSSY